MFGVDAMGLFWSMQRLDDSAERIQTINASDPLTYDFSIFDGHVNPLSASEICIDSITIERNFLGDGIGRYPLKEGNIRGTLFVPKGDGPFPAVMTLYGGNKRRHVVEDAAALLANNGFVTLAAAYFGVEDLPKKLCNSAN